VWLEGMEDATKLLLWAVLRILLYLGAVLGGLAVAGVVGTTKFQVHGSSSTCLLASSKHARARSITMHWRGGGMRMPTPRAGLGRCSHGLHQPGQLRAGVRVRSQK
jgi:hypothetical protein